MYPKTHYHSNDLFASGEFGYSWSREVDSLEDAKIEFTNFSHIYDITHALYSEYIVKEVTKQNFETIVINWTIGMKGEILNNNFSHIMLWENGEIVEYPITVE